MRRRGRLTGTLCAGLLALVFVTGAAAATPQQIYNDIADNQRLDGKYSNDDLERALAGDFKRSLREQRATEPNRVPSAVPADDTGSGRALPFTGLDLALLTAGGGPLVLIGVTLRRRLMLEQAAARRHDLTAA